MYMYLFLWPFLLLKIVKNRYAWGWGVFFFLRLKKLSQSAAKHTTNLHNCKLATCLFYVYSSVLQVIITSNLHIRYLKKSNPLSPLGIDRM